MRGDWYQFSLIFLAIVVTALFGGFLYREMFPEYKKYQDAYIALEKFRSTYTGRPPPPFQSKIKQIVLESKNNAPPVVNRCTSCHVAVQFSHFAPTRIAKDINGNPVYNEEGLLVQEPNPEYIWAKLDQKISILKLEGNEQEAKKLQALKTAQVGDHVYDMTKVLRAHPLMGRETRPFEYHPIDEYGCTVCHNGNGRGLTADKAHGPVYDGQYEAENMGPTPEFTEKDSLNDPAFARIFNHKPGHQLLFQTTPLYVGALIQANCIQCHHSSAKALEGAAREAGLISKRREEKSKAIQKAYLDEKKALISLVKLKWQLDQNGWDRTIERLSKSAHDDSKSKEEMLAGLSQLDFLQKQGSQEKAVSAISDRIQEMMGTSRQTAQLMNIGSFEDIEKKVESVIDSQTKGVNGTGTLFAKKRAMENDQQLMILAAVAKSTISDTAKNENVQGVLAAEIDLLTKNYHFGKELFLSQACYACHRIDGFTRGGVGPELTNIGNYYPWYIKESIVWPQANLKTSTMPNFRLDHEELENLTTFLLAQKGRRPATSEANYRAQLLEWENGYQLPFERPINPGNQFDLRFSMTVFATEGCASCHRLKGFESNAGFIVEKEKKPSFETLFNERQWFRKLVPEEISGSELVNVLDSSRKEIDSKIVNDARKDSLLEEIEAGHPGVIESYYTNFKYASRAKDHHYKELINLTKDPVERKKLADEQNEWKERVRRVLMMYIQEYGLGRLVGPKPNWSGIYRSDEWLMEHFKKPSQLVARSIMPVLPFDESKFYALTYMLDRLSVRNRDEVRKIWDTFGFDPKLAYQIHCAQCHGDYKRGNGPVAEWIYPIPKNLTNTDFLRNLTRENAIISIARGIGGSPMPPWGEVAVGKNLGDGKPVLTKNEVEQLVDWLYAPLAGRNANGEKKEVSKWRYGPVDVLKELKKEKDVLNPSATSEYFDAGRSDFLLGKTTVDSKDNNLTSPAPVAAAENVFDVHPNPNKEKEKYLYYIKKKYYTKQNLEQGKAFFELNCASCHGRDADGQGYRAQAMHNAKPRMLTNFPWIHTLDDLRLLRSIKYGVAGTAMTPWGDQTSSLQRLQLVMYIRSLSVEQQLRNQLADALYQAFEEQNLEVQKARAQLYKQLNPFSKELESLKMNSLEALSLAAPPKTDIKNVYQQEMELSQKIRSGEAVDSVLLKIKESLNEEKKIYQNIGNQLVDRPRMHGIFNRFLDLVKLSHVVYTFEDGKLYQIRSVQKEKDIQDLQEEISRKIQKIIYTAQAEKSIEEGKFPSKERFENLDDLNERIYGYKSLQKAFISGFEEAKRLRKKQMKLYAVYERK